jgi:hypothetical protein
MIELICKVLGHSTKHVEGARGDVVICKRCGEIKHDYNITLSVLRESFEESETSQESKPTQNIVDERELLCDKCENEITTVSRFAGDSCPDCKTGYLIEKPRP